MRIIAGKHKGRKIEVGKDPNREIRPTSEFAREAIFNILMHSKHITPEQSFIGKPVLDVFCGTGAFGLEALSRGAAQVTFVDQSREAMAAARYNAERMGELDHVDFYLTDASKLGRAKKRYGLVFLDPPYFEKLVEPTLKALQTGGWLEEGALVIVEHDAKENITLPAPFTLLDERRYGRALIRVLKAN